MTHVHVLPYIHIQRTCTIMYLCTHVHVHVHTVGRTISIWPQSFSQIYDVIDQSSDWWFARLVRDVTPDGMLGKQGWVAGSFLDKFSSELSFAEEAAIMSGTCVHVQ